VGTRRSIYHDGLSIGLRSVSDTGHARTDRTRFTKKEVHGYDGLPQASAS